MSATSQKRYKKRSNFVTFERDLVSAAVDVSVIQLRSSVGAQFPAAAGTPWDKFAGSCGPDTCSGLAQLADKVADLTSVPKHAVSWVVAGLLHAVGCPPFVAQIIGRMVANWLLQPLNDIDPVVRAIRLLGVAVCAESGELGYCPCLVDLAWQVGQSELKVEIDKGLDLSTGMPTEPRKPVLRPVEKVELPRPAPVETTERPGDMHRREAEATTSERTAPDEGRPHQASDSVGRTSHPPRTAETTERTGDIHRREAEATTSERTTHSEGRPHQASDSVGRTSHPPRPVRPAEGPEPPRFPEPPETVGRTGTREPTEPPEPPEPPGPPGPKWPPDPPETGPEGGGPGPEGGGPGPEGGGPGPEGGGPGPEGGGPGPEPAQPKPGLVKLKDACEATRGDVVPPVPQIFGTIR
jgi:hypothetical protein